jgi:hypothetical protein
VGEAEVADADGLEGADLHAAVAAVAGAVACGHAVPGQAGAAVQQGWLVGLDHQQVVRLLLAHQELGGILVGLECVGGHDHAVKVQRLKQRGEGGDNQAERASTPAPKKLPAVPEPADSAARPSRYARRARDPSAKMTSRLELAATAPPTRPAPKGTARAAPHR